MARTSRAYEAVKTLSFNDIDEYTLAHIFQYLSLIDRTKVERVCKRWKRASREYGYLYSKHLTIGSDMDELPFFNKSVQENESKLEKILRYRCKYIEDVNFTSECHYKLYEQAIPLLSQWCPKLKRLDAHNLKVHNDNLINLVEGCPNLEELTLGMGLRGPLKENELNEFFCGAKRLKGFGVQYQMSMTGTCLLKLQPGILESLEIEDCISFHLTPEIAAFLAPSLRRFSYSGYSRKYKQNLENIAQLPNLRRLLISVNPNQLTKCILKRIVRSCSLLEAVDLDRSLMGNQDHDITPLLDLPNLKELAIRSKMPTGEDVLMNKSFEKIERLTLGCSIRMNVEAYRILINRLPALQYFSVCSCSLDRPAARVLGKNVIVAIYFHSESYTDTQVLESIPRSHFINS